MSEEDLMGLRPLTPTEMGLLKTKQFYACGLLNKFLSMKRDAAALDCPDESTAMNLCQKLRAVIRRANLNRWLGAYTAGDVLYLNKTTEEEIPELTEDQMKALEYRGGKG